ncbi:MAG: sortase, partial [Actinomycetota bacterium]
PAPPAPESRPRPANPRAIALLKIPRIGVDVIVVEGVRLPDLVYGPGRYPQSAKIGADGSTAIAGHRTGWGSPFLNVDRLRVGDAITVQVPSGTVYRYRVSGTRVVGPGASWVLRGKPGSTATRQLTLTTCTPKFTSRNRLIIWADLVATEDRD